MKRIIALAICAICCVSLTAQPPQGQRRERPQRHKMVEVDVQPTEVKLYPNGAPNSSGITKPESADASGNLFNVTEATLTIYQAPAERATGQAVVICPGGAYIFEAMNNEGHPVAKWMVRHGVTAVVLKYRLPNGNPDVPIGDALAAIEYVRAHAAELNVNPAEVGVIGFSAGGHLAASASTRFTSTANRPDFSILVYPVITLGAETHVGSRNSLLGKDASEELVTEYSCQNNVTADTPPTFIVHCNDDRVVPVENTFMYMESLRKAGVKHSGVIYESGGHGWGFLEGPGRLESWRMSFYSNLRNWLRVQNK